MNTCGKICILLVMITGAAGVAGAQTNQPPLADGTIVEQVLYKFPFRTYEEWIEWSKKNVPNFNETAFRKNAPQEHFDFVTTTKEIECLKVKYISDGLKVTGYIVKPTDTIGKKYPVFVFVPGYNPGGQIRPFNIFNFYGRVKTQGVVVLFPAFRGNDGGEGRDEFGGADVNDVLNLVTLAKSQAYMDPHRMVLYGAGRGGMMIYLALAKGMMVRAAAVENVPTDVEAWAKQNPAVLEAFKKALPDFETRAPEYYRSRSIIFHTEKINTPLFIRHGSGNKRVPAANALKFVERLEALGKYYELIIYPNDDPDITVNDPEDDRRVDVWLKKYTQ